jgi:hypothetical protein
MTLRELANKIQTDKNTVKGHLEAYHDILPRMEETRQRWFEQNKAKILRGIVDLACEELIKQIRIGELSGRDLTKAIETLTKLGRLEQGKSTENIAHAHHVTGNAPEMSQILIDPPKDKG